MNLYLLNSSPVEDVNEQFRGKQKGQNCLRGNGKPLSESPDRTPPFTK